jgi:hypothetical protein
VRQRLLRRSVLFRRSWMYWMVSNAPAWRLRELGLRARCIVFHTKQGTAVKRNIEEERANVRPYYYDSPS